jgi:hypothetical protein
MLSLGRIEQFKNQNLHPDGCQKFLWLRRLVFLILLEHYQTGILIAFAPVSQCSRPEVFQGGIFCVTKTMGYAHGCKKAEAEE